MRNFQLPGRSPVYARNGTVATSHPLASTIALDVLKSGGNAVDAAIAAGAVLCVVEPHMTGIGGDCFAIVSEPDGQVFGYNGSGRTANAAKTTWFLERDIKDISPDSIHSVTVPGALKAWETLLAKHGRFGLDHALEKAIDYGEQGYNVAPRIACDWQMLSDDLLKDPGARKHYLLNGEAPKAGQMHYAPALARTFRAVAENGPDAFYQGEIAAEIAALVRHYGGLLTEDDLAAVSCDRVDPVFASYRGVEIGELPPNGQGVAALAMLRILEQFDMKDLDPHGGRRHHLEIEAARLAYGLRDAHIADPDYMTFAPDILLADSFIAKLARQISPERRNSDLPIINPSQSDTVYLTVVDEEGRAISFINSLFRGFGARICTEKSGVMLQNRGSGFVVKPGHPNCIDGGKRPLHTIIPAIARKNGRVWLSFGVMGGAYQAFGHAHLLVNLIDYGMDVQEAIDCERLFWAPDGTVLAESGLSADAFEWLSSIGHSICRSSLAIGGGQAILIDPSSGTLSAGSDGRKDGLALGY